MINLKTVEIDKYIHEQLIKPYSDKLTEQDLIKINKIILNKYNIKGEEIEYHYSDLKLLSNLERCSLEIIDINDDLIENLNTLKHIKTIEFSHNKIKTAKTISCNLYKIVLNFVTENVLNLIENCESVETIEIIESDGIDINDLIKFKNIKNLYLYNCRISNSGMLKSLYNLETLKLDGSKLDDENILNELSNSIKITRNISFILANA